MTDLYVIATLVSKPGKADALRAVLLPIVEAFRSEDGCLAYTLLEDGGKPGTFVTFEKWRDRAALDAHMHSEAMERVKPELPGLLGAEMTQQFLSALKVL